MLKNRSDILAASTIVILLMLPLTYFTVSLQLEKQNNDDAFLKRLTFIGGSIQRLIKLPEHPAGLAADIDEAFRSSEEIYPALLHPNDDEAALATDYFKLKACWDTVKKMMRSASPGLQKQGEICWLQTNKTIFDLHYVIDNKRKAMLNDIFMLAFFGALLLLFLLYQIFKYVRTDLEQNQLVDLKTGLFNTRAFLEESVRSCILASRTATPYSIILIKFHDKKKSARSVKLIVENLKKSSRREEKLFKLSPVSYAIITVNTPKKELSPLIDRLTANLTALQNRFVYDILEYLPGSDTEKFGPFCLERLSQMDTPS
jgi:GGDEF domain-containing protein